MSAHASGERAAVCRALIDKGKVADRARAVLASLYHRDGVAGPATEDLVPSLFSLAGGDLLRVRNLCHSLMGWRPSRRTLEANPALRYPFGLVSFYRHDFTKALQELGWAARHQGNRIERCLAREIVDYLLQVPYHELDLLQQLKEPGLPPNLSELGKKSLLVLANATQAEVEPVLAGLSEMTRATVVFDWLKPGSVSPRPRTEYCFPDVNEWFDERGRQIHGQLVSLCQVAARAAGRVDPLLAKAPWSTCMSLVDGALFEFWQFHAFAERLRADKPDAVLVITRDPIVFLAARNIARRQLRDRAILVHWLSRPPLPLPTGFVYWPDMRSLKAFFRAKWAGKHARGIRAGLAEPPPLPPPETFMAWGSERPALLSWSIDGPQYEKAFVKMAREVLRHRPVLVLAMGVPDDQVERIRVLVADLAEESGRRASVVFGQQFMRLGEQRAGDLEPAISAVKSLVCGWPWRFLSRFRADKDIGRVFLRQNLSHRYLNSRAFRSLRAGLSWLDAVLPHLRPAYFIGCPTRLPLHAISAECARTHGLATMDIHLFFLGPQARSVQPPAHFFATIDSQGEDFLVDFWKLDRANTVRVGYLWSDPSDSAADNENGSPDAPLILCATQPAEAEIACGFLQGVIDSLRAVPQARLAVKFHPREAATDLLRDVIKNSGFAGRISVLEETDRIADWIPRASLVITRTSNVALEAAVNFRPVVRAVMFEHRLPETFLSVEYAENARSMPELNEAVQRLLTDRAAREALENRQRAYFQTNPSLVDGQGARRAVEFLEKHCDATAQADRT